MTKENNPRRTLLIINTALNYCLVVLVVVCCGAIVHAMLREPPVKSTPVRNAGGGIPVIDMARLAPVCASRLYTAAFEDKPNPNPSFTAADSELDRVCNSVVSSSINASNKSGEDR
jgi:hypothetical protein